MYCTVGPAPVYVTVPGPLKDPAYGTDVYDGPMIGALDAIGKKLLLEERFAALSETVPLKGRDDDAAPSSAVRGLPKKNSMARKECL